MPRILLCAATSILLAIPALAQNGFSTVDPAAINLSLAAGETVTETVSIQIHPLCFRAYDIDVVASDPDPSVANLSGVQVNGCGGDQTFFDVEITGSGTSQSFDLVFVDAEFGGDLASIPVQISGDDSGSIHGIKWQDQNGDGRRDRSEPGLAGVTIYLDANANGRLDRGEPATVSMRDDPNTNLDESGRYWLEGITPGRFLLREVVPPGFGQTFPRGGAHAGELQSGQTLEGLDFGNQRIRPGSIHGTKWSDTNGDGRRDANEPGLPGVVIYSDLDHNGRLDADEPHATTMQDDPNTDFDESGHYWLEGLAPGRHIVAEVVPDGFVQTFPPCHGTHDVLLGVGVAVDGIDFGNRPPPPPGSIHGTKWLDTDGDGRRAADEPGLPGVTVYVDLDDDGVFDRDEPATVTMRDDPNTDFDESGMYWLEGLEPGLNVVREIVPDGFLQTFPDGDGSHRVELGRGDVVDGADFGNQPDLPGSVHGVKWLDTNGDGRRDANEPGLPGVVIYVDRNANGRLDPDEPHSVSMEDDPNTDFDEAGLYWLEGLEAGHKVVREVVPDGFRQTFPEQGYHRIVLESGDVIDGLDFGNARAMRCDMDRNQWVDMTDIRMLAASMGQPARAGLGDTNGDGVITGNDVMTCMQACDDASCEP